MFLASKIGFEYIEPGCVAQLVEQLTLNQRVRGSSPRASTTPKAPKKGLFSCKKAVFCTSGFFRCSLFFPSRSLSSVRGALVNISTDFHPRGALPHPLARHSSPSPPVALGAFVRRPAGRSGSRYGSVAGRFLGAPKKETPPGVRRGPRLRFASKRPPSGSPLGASPFAWASVSWCRFPATLRQRRP